MSITDGNILKPSEVDIPGGGGGTPTPVFLDLSTTPLTAPIIRVVNFTGASDAQTLYITDTGTAGGNALFTNIYFAQIGVINAAYGNPNDQFTCSVEILSNSSIKVGFGSIVYGAATGDVSVILIGD